MKIGDRKRHLYNMQEHNLQSGIRVNFFISIPAAILIGSVIISLAILINGGVIRFKRSTSKTTSVAAQTPTQPAQQAPQTAPEEDSGPVKVSIDDDPMMGDKNAKLTVIEFSDFECPFCKRSFNDVIPNLKKDYIDKGLVRFVYRDLPLSFHQNAHKEAQAAECARDQGGDTSFFKYHDEIFKRTISNGTGLALDQLPVIATDLGLNVSQFQQCLDSGKYKDEVDKDTAYAEEVGANGTPTWFIGKTTGDGIIEGTKIVGAQPMSSFQSTIDNLLK